MSGMRSNSREEMLSCLISTSTYDGAGDERKTAFQLVQQGNDIWCAAHRVQLAIGDCLNPKIARPPGGCAPHRAVILKAHDLVVWINSHRVPRQRSEEHTSELPSLMRIS